MRNLGNKFAAYANAYVNQGVSKFKGLKEQENGDVVQTVIILVVFIIAATVVANWIWFAPDSVIKTQQSKADACLTNPLTCEG